MHTYVLDNYLHRVTYWTSGTNSEQVYGQAFELFAGFGGTDTVEAKKLGTLLASLGMNMSDEDGMPRCPLWFHLRFLSVHGYPTNKSNASRRW